MVEASAALRRTQAVMGLDSRWVSENGLCLAAKDGWSVARDYFEAMSTQRPGDGVLAALHLQARERSGESADWQSLRGRFEELAPIVRAAQHPLAGRDRELVLAVASATEDGNVHWNSLDDDIRQALWVLDRSASHELSQLTREDFLAARQLTVL